MKTPPLLLGNGQRRRTCASGTRSDDTSVAATSKDNPRLDASSHERNADERERIADERDQAADRGRWSRTAAERVGDDLAGRRLAGRSRGAGADDERGLRDGGEGVDARRCLRVPEGGAGLGGECIDR